MTKYFRCVNFFSAGMCCSSAIAVALNGREDICALLVLLSITNIIFGLRP